MFEVGDKVTAWGYFNNWTPEEHDYDGDVGVITRVPSEGDSYPYFAVKFDRVICDWDEDCLFHEGEIAPVI